MPDGKLYTITDKKVGDRIQFRSTVKPDKDFIRQKFEEKRANEAQLAEVKRQAAQDSAFNYKNALTGNIPDVSEEQALANHPVLSGITDLGTGLAEGATGLVEMPVEAAKNLYGIVRHPLESADLYKRFFQQPATEQAQAIPFVPEATEISQGKNVLRNVGRLGGMTLAGAGIARAAARTPKLPMSPYDVDAPKIAEAPRIAPTVEPIVPKVAPEAAPKISKPTKLQRSQLISLQTLYKEVPRDERLKAASDIIQRPIKSFNELNNVEAQQVIDSFKKTPEQPVQTPMENVVTAPEVPTEAPVEPNILYSPDKLAQMTAEEIDYAAKNPPREPLITPPPVTSLAVKPPEITPSPILEDLSVEAPQVKPRWSNEPILEEKPLLQGQPELIDETAPQQFRPPYGELPPELEESLNVEAPIEEPLGRPTPAILEEPQKPQTPPEPPIIPQEQVVPPLSSKEAVEAAGAKYEGEAEGLVYFTDPQTRSTLVLKPEEVTPESVSARLAESRAKFAEAEKPAKLNPEQQEFLAKGGKITKVPPVEPTEPLEFGRALEEPKSKIERSKRREASLLERLAKEEEGFADVEKFKEFGHNLRGWITSTDQFLDTNPATRPISDLITKEAEIPKTQWLVKNLDELSALKKRYKGINAERLFDIAEGTVKPNLTEARAAADLRTLYDKVFDEAWEKGVTTWEGEPIQYLQDYMPHIKNAMVDLPGMWDSIKSIFRGEEFNEPKVSGTEKVYAGRQTPEPRTPHAEHRIGELETLNKDIWEVSRRYLESMSRAMFDAPAVRKARTILKDVPEGFDKDMATWYLQHYTGFDALPYMARFAKSVDRTLARMGARSVLFGNTRLQVLHLARTLTQIWPEVPTTDLLAGFAKTVEGMIRNPKDPFAATRKAGLIQQQISPMNLKRPMEKLDAIGNFLDFGNSFAKTVSFEANKRSMPLDKAVAKTMKDEGMVTPARPVRALETSRMFVQFKYWLFKYAENAANAMADVAKEPNLANFARMSKYAAAALTAYYTAKKTGLSLWHAGFRSLELVSGMATSTATRIVQDMAQGKWDKVAKELVQYAIPGGHSIPRELPASMGGKGPTFIHETAPSKKRSAFKKFKSRASVQPPFQQDYPVAAPV